MIGTFDLADFPRTNLTFSTIHRIIVGSGRRKLRRTGIHHFINRPDTVFLSKRFDLRSAPPCKPGDHIVRKFNPLGLLQQLRCQLLCLQRFLHFHQDSNFINKPSINHRDFMYSLIGNAFSNGFRNHPDSPVVRHLQPALQLFRTQITEIIGKQAVRMLFQGTDGLHQGSLKIITDTHNLTGGLHLGSKRTLCRNKLIKRQSRYLHHAVIQCGFETGISLLRDGIFDLIQGVTQSNLCRHLGDWVACGLGSQGRGPAHPGIHLDDTVLKAGGMQRELHIAAAGNLQLVYDIQRGCPQHLVFLVAQSLGRRHHNAVSRMHTHRVYIFHVADSDAVPCTVPHDFILDLLPSCDTSLHQYLSHPGKPQTVFQDLLQFHLSTGNPAAGTAQSIGRPQYHRITDGIGKFHTVLYGLYHL